MGKLGDAFLTIMTTVVGGVLLTVITQRLTASKKAAASRTRQRYIKDGQMTTTLGLLMIIVGLGLTSIGVLILTRKPAEVVQTVPEPAASASAPRTPAPASVASRPASKANTPRFEEWVKVRFIPKYYSVKPLHGTATASPDYEVEFRLHGIGHLFAVVCKWKPGFEEADKPFVVWASAQEIADYQQFATKTNLPVFVILGVGGAPDDPNEVYLVNLNLLKYPRANADYLARFNRSKKDADFYYDFNKPELR